MTDAGTVRNVFLDTSSLRGVGRATLAGRMLKRIVEREKLVLHVPDLVEKELASGFAKPNHVDLADAQCRVAAWFDELGVVRHGIAPLDANEVFSLYFGGKPPFRSPKNRNDIPDAFIFVCLRSFAGRASEHVHALVADRALRGACAALPNVTAHASLPALVGAVNPWLPSDELRAVCMRQFDTIRSEINAQLESRLRDDGVIPSGVELLEMGQLEPLGHGSVDWSDADPLDEEYISLPFYGRVSGNVVELRGDAAAAAAGRVGVGSGRLAADVGFEAWLDVRVVWEGEGKPTEMQLRVVSADVELASPAAVA